MHNPGRSGGAFRAGIRSGIGIGRLGLGLRTLKLWAGVEHAEWAVNTMVEVPCLGFEAVRAAGSGEEEELRMIQKVVSDVRSPAPHLFLACRWDSGQ